jgi:hypothetical protein
LSSVDDDRNDAMSRSFSFDVKVITGMNDDDETIDDDGINDDDDDDCRVDGKG